MKNSGTLKKDAADILRATLIALLLSLVMVLCFALIVRLAGLDGTALTVGNYVIKALSVLVGVCIGFRTLAAGAVKGGITGVLYTLVTVFVFAAADGFKHIFILALTGSGSCLLNPFCFIWLYANSPCFELC